MQKYYKYRQTIAQKDHKLFRQMTAKVFAIFVKRLLQKYLELLQCKKGEFCETVAAKIHEIHLASKFLK